MEVSPGDIVYSLAGRDKGYYFVVMSVLDNYAFICDGRNRKTDKSKKKKIKHLKTGFGHSDYIEKKIINGEKVSNSELRRELDSFAEH